MPYAYKLTKYWILILQGSKNNTRDKVLCPAFS